MSKRNIYIIISIIFLGISSVQADSNACNSISSTQDLLSCVQSNHPKVKEALIEMEAARELEEVGSQRPNPELEGGFTRGKSLGDVILEREVKLSQEIEIGGKRGARIDKAKAQFSLSAAVKQKTVEEVTIKTVLVLHRLRQIEEEIEVLKEALSTFNRAQNQYRKRQSLSPENEVSLNVFELAESEHKLQKQILLEEQRHLKSYIGIATGLEYSLISKHLPKHKENWPELNSGESTTGHKSSDVRAAQAEVQVADSEVSLQKAESWPNLTVAPLYQRNSDGGVNYDAYGLSLSFPLPLWHANGGGRAHAYKEKTLAEVKLKNKLTKIDRLRKVELEAYQSLVQAIKDTRSHESVEKKHKKVERLFKRGLVSSPLVIEAHRQILDFLKGQHEHEIRALEALWTIFAIDGDILSKQI